MKNDDKNRYSNPFKARVAPGAISEELTLAALLTKHGKQQYAYATRLSVFGGHSGLGYPQGADMAVEHVIGGRVLHWILAGGRGLGFASAGLA